MADRLEHPDEERDVAELKRIAFLIDQLGFRAHDAEAIGEDADAVVGAEDAQAILLRSVAAELPALRQQLTDANLAARYNADVSNQAIARAEAAEAQLTEAQADRDRLDFIEATACDIVHFNAIGRLPASWAVDLAADAPEYTGEGLTLRAAVDAARLASSSEKPANG